MENPKDFLSAESKTKILYQNLKKNMGFSSPITLDTAFRLMDLYIVVLI